MMPIKGKAFDGKVALITASSTGIGLAIAKRLSSEGCKVIISSRDQNHVDKAVKEIKEAGGQAYGIVCHVGSKEQRLKLIDETVKKYGGIDFLIPNAAISTHMGNFFEANEGQISKMWDINYKSVFLLVQEALPHLRKRPNSNIVILASYVAYDPSSVIGHYSITKTALVALTKVIAKELLHENIRANCIAPGIIKTRFSGSLWEGKEKQTMEHMGITRLGEVEDIANAARFLCSQESSYMTGECLFVAGKPSPRL